MRKTVIAVLGAMLILTGIATQTPLSAETREKITFITNARELHAALRQKDSIEALAIRTAVYRNADPATRYKIEDLAHYVLTREPRPVWLYGDSPSAHEAISFLRGWYDGDGCEPLAYAGVLIYTTTVEEQRNGRNWTKHQITPLTMCGASSSPKPEKWYRDSLLSQWRDAREYMRKGGYKFP